MRKEDYDSLDYERMAQSSQSRASQPQNDLVPHQYKNYYKMELDHLVAQKNEQKRAAREQEQRERQNYNQRIRNSQQAQKMKDLSYKNYYQMLLNNQSSISQHYVSPYSQRDSEKSKFIDNQIQAEKQRSQQWLQQEQRRQQEMKKNYRELLSEQISQKKNMSLAENQQKQHLNEEFKKVTISPQEVARLERERKLHEMQKYRQDLDHTRGQPLHVERQRSVTNPTLPQRNNDFNVSGVGDRHNPMVNPMPFNMQNPYILREMRRKQALEGGM